MRDVKIKCSVEKLVALKAHDFPQVLEVTGHNGYGHSEVGSVTLPGRDALARELADNAEL